jgi:myo-inositol 2-dehydrogenase/D-chiro-inositol 1-dehydrogenase
MTSNNKLRFAVLGAGRMGKTHAHNLAGRIAGADLVALVDSAADALVHLAAETGVADAYDDYRRVLERKDVDAVVVATPTPTHYQVILDSASAGKHIFCEKPLDISVDKIQAAIQAAEAGRVQMMLGFNRRFDPNFAKVRDTVAAGGVGAAQVLRITSRDPAPPPEAYIRSSGGIFQDMTIHDFDMARFLMGSEVTEVYARATVLVDSMFERARDWDTAIVTLQFASGAVGAIDNSRQAVYGYDQRVEVFGAGGMIAAANCTADTHVRLDQHGVHSAPPLHFFLERYAEAYRNEMQAFVDALRANSPVPVTGRDGLAATLVALAAAQSARTNQPVKVAIVPALESIHEKMKLS